MSTDRKTAKRLEKIASELIAIGNESGEFSYMAMQAGATVREISKGMNGDTFDPGYVREKTDKLMAAARRVADMEPLTA